MISADAALGVVAVALALVLTPGPNMLYLVSRSISQGRRAGLISLAGVALGFLVYLIAAAMGLAAVFATVPVLYTIVKTAGVCCLLWLAWMALRPGGRSVFQPQQLPRDRPLRLLAMGFTTNILNPKIAIMYISLLPQILDPARVDVVRQSMQLGAVQIAVALTVNAMIVLTAATIGALLATRPRWLTIQRWATGGTLAAIAVSLAFERERPAV